MKGAIVANEVVSANEVIVNLKRVTHFERVESGGQGLARILAHFMNGQQAVVWEGPDEDLITAWHNLEKLTEARSLTAKAPQT